MSSPLSVLVVHPTSKVAHRIARTVRRAGHRALVFKNGEQAIDRFIQEPADALIVEMVLPGRDGEATIESIRWAPEGRTVPAILIGTRGTSDERITAAAAHIHAHATFTAPLDHEALGKVLSGLRTAAHPAPEDRMYVSSEQSAAPPEASARDAELLASPPYMPAHEPPPSMDAAPEPDRGFLGRAPFPRLLHQLAQRRATGVMTVEVPAARDHGDLETRKVIYFRNGLPVYIESNLERECLGRLLFRNGRIMESTLQESLQRMQAGEGLQGAVLVRMGALNGRELEEALHEQLLIKLFDLFGRTEGTYAYEDHEQGPPHIISLEMSLGAIVLEGVMSHIPAERLLDELRSRLDAYVIPDVDQMARYRNVDMAEEARQVLQTLDGTKRLRSLLAEAGERPGAVAQLIYALQATEAVSFEVEPRLSPRLESSDRSGELPKSVSAPNLAELSDELVHLDRLLRQGDIAQALGVAASDPQVVAEAAQRLLPRYRGLTEPGATPPAIRQLAYDVCEHLRQIERMERQPKPGKRRREGSGRRRARPQLRVEQPPQLAAGLEQGTTPSRRRRHSRPASLGVKQDLDIEQTKRGKRLGSRAAPEAPAAPAAPPSPGTLDDDVQRLYEAERHFRKGDRALKEGRADEATAAFSRAVELCPEEGEFLAHLGYSRYLLANGDPQVARRAVAELEKSCELAPSLELAYVLWARVLRDLGETEAARKAYQGALAANPECSEAADGLRALSH